MVVPLYSTRSLVRSLDQSPRCVRRRWIVCWSNCWSFTWWMQLWRTWATFYGWVHLPLSVYIFAYFHFSLFLWRVPIWANCKPDWRQRWPNCVRTRWPLSMVSIFPIDNWIPPSVPLTAMHMSVFSMRLSSPQWTRNRCQRVSTSTWDHLWNPTCNVNSLH